MPLALSSFYHHHLAFNLPVSLTRLNFPAMTDPALVAAWRVSVSAFEKSFGRAEFMERRPRDNHMHLQWELDLVRLSVSALDIGVPAPTR